MGKRHLWELAAAALFLAAALVISGVNGRPAAAVAACACAVLAALAVYRFARENRRALERTAGESQYREQLLATLSDSVDDIFILFGADGRQVEYVSPNIKRLMGVPAEQLYENPGLLCRLSTEEGYTSHKRRSAPSRGAAASAGTGSTSAPRTGSAGGTGKPCAGWCSRERSG